MVPPKGHNLKYFYHDENKIVRRATASVSNYTQDLSFNVPTDKKYLIKEVLDDLVFFECDTETYGTWIKVLGINKIKVALLKLKEKNLISEDFYKNVSENFPKPYGGTINILEKSWPFIWSGIPIKSSILPNEESLTDNKSLSDDMRLEDRKNESVSIKTFGFN